MEIREYKWGKEQLCKSGLQRKLLFWKNQKVNLSKKQENKTIDSMSQ